MAWLPLAKAMSRRVRKISEKTSVRKKRQQHESRLWRVMDLHLHTRASGDFQEADATYLDVLKRCEARGLDIVAFTDHNTVAGYRLMQDEIKQLELLESLGRMTPAERDRLAEYRRLLGKMLVLPGFEFTATFGFHVLGIFPPEKTVREIEHLLLSLNISSEHLDDGSMTVGASSDVLSAYRLIHDAGGLVIAAHANSTNGVAMRGFPFGGQTKIAYTQDPNLHALEVTDLGQGGRHSTAAFFLGTKPEYPRRMHCIQGSDSHRLRADPENKKNPGIGDRATEVLLTEVSFGALSDLFQSNDFARTRPRRVATEEALDFVQQAREEGASIVQDFHESLSTRSGKRYAVIADICALANTNGGTLYLGVPADASQPPIGIQGAEAAARQLEKETATRISPPLRIQVDTQETRGKTIIRVLVPRGEEPPYAVDDNKIYLRQEAETAVAVRDEIVQMVRRAVKDRSEPVAPAVEVPESPTEVETGVQPPRTGVEVVSFEERNGVRYYTLRDLRNSNVVKNVTAASARRLWHYAITQHMTLPSGFERSIAWQGEVGTLGEQRRGRGRRFDLAQRTREGLRLYYGVTEDGIHSEWKRLVGSETE